MSLKAGNGRGRQPTAARARQRRHQRITACRAFDVACEPVACLLLHVAAQERSTHDQTRRVVLVCTGGRLLLGEEAGEGTAAAASSCRSRGGPAPGAHFLSTCWTTHAPANKLSYKFEIRYVVNRLERRKKAQSEVGAHVLARSLNRRRFSWQIESVSWRDVHGRHRSSMFVDEDASGRRSNRWWRSRDDGWRLARTLRAHVGCR